VYSDSATISTDSQGEADQESRKSVTEMNGVDVMSAPADYSAFFLQYYKYVISLVRQQGITPESAEDVACDILVRFYERDFLPKFDPGYKVVYKGEIRPARFKSFLNAFVMAYVRNHRDRQARVRRRELLICDMPLGGTETTWIEVFGGVESPNFGEAWEEHLLVTRLRARLQEVPRRSKLDRCDLVKVFDLVVDQVREGGEISYPELSAALGISSTATHSWVKWLKENIHEALFAGTSS
jgi:DNA-directed RNA polymerase specialized sigma24 family protein